MKVKKIFKYAGKSFSFTSAFRGMFGAALAGLGWKIASDLYDLVKEKIKEGQAEADLDEGTSTR